LLSTAKRRHEVVDEQRAMVEAIRSRDGPAVAGATSRHIQNTKAAVEHHGDAA
jgi:DNA-binding GntR family transcriptional regulator